MALPLYTLFMSLSFWQKVPVLQPDPLAKQRGTPPCQMCCSSMDNPYSERMYSYKYLGILLHLICADQHTYLYTLCSEVSIPVYLLQWSMPKIYLLLGFRATSLYTPFIHPHLEYATAVWNPHLSKDIRELGSLGSYCIFTKLFMGLLTFLVYKPCSNYYTHPLTL